MDELFLWVGWLVRIVRCRLAAAIGSSSARSGFSEVRSASQTDGPTN